MAENRAPDFAGAAGKRLAEDIKALAKTLGFQQAGITDLSLEGHGAFLRRWLGDGFHADMDWMQTRLELRLKPQKLSAGAIRAVMCRMDYLPAKAADHSETLADGRRAYIARYALGRDYHKTLRARLARLARFMTERAGGVQRAFVDSAPVMERALAQDAGLGWIGKNTMLINRRAGSWFFLGGVLSSLPLPVDAPVRKSYCGSCRACLDICPTGAFSAPGRLDARRCVAYLTIENKGPIPQELRPLIGNRIFGCDDCQLICPWNRFARPSREPDFSPRARLDVASLAELSGWSEAVFDEKTRGSPVRRPGYQGWLRNLALALGNAPRSKMAQAALRAMLPRCAPMAAEHVAWGLRRQGGRL